MSSSNLRSTAVEDKDQCIVQTPYGRGLCIKTREKLDNHEMREIRLVDWDTLTPQNKQQQQPTLYSAIEYPSVKPMVSDDVVCFLGRGRVVSIRQQEQQCVVVVKLSSWRLAGRSLPVCYLSLDSVRVVRKKTLREMNVYERVEYAQQKKKAATKFFADKNPEKALEMYATAVDAVRYVQHDASSSNEVRADLLVIMITCCNNTATCSVQLSRWDDAIKFSKNALVLLDALYNKRGFKVHSILNKEGYRDAKLFGEWRVKSYLVMGRAMTEKGDCSGALTNLKKAHDLVVEYSQAEGTDPSSAKVLASQEKNRKRLHHTCVLRKKADKKKEKERALAMFGNETNKAKAVPPKAKTGPSKANASPSSVIDIKKGAPDSEDEFDRRQQDALGGLSPQPAAVTSSAKDTSRIVKEKVSTSEVDEVADFSDLEEEEDEQLPWYDEHKEALILTAACGLAILSASLLRRSRK